MKEVNSEVLLKIGLPVYNGERFIGQTIESILNQSLKEFKLVISDNASTDATEEICRAYGQTDKRIHYARNPENIGLVRNTEKVFQESQPSKYFAFIGHDDVWFPEFAEKLISLLEENSQSSLAFSWYEYIDADGERLSVRERAHSYEKFPDMVLQNRRERISFQPSANFVHGIIRSKFVDPSYFTQSYGIYEDVFMLRALAAHGPFLLCPEVLFKKRIHQGNYSITKEYIKENRRLNCFCATKELKRRFQLSFLETISLWLSLLSYFKVKRFAFRNWFRAKKALGIVFKLKVP